MKLEPGTIFEKKYRIVRMLGKGGMGAVYEVEHLRVPGRYALKVMLPELGSDEGFRDRFFREIAIARGLVHPNVVTIRDCDVAEGGSCYFTMDLVQGAPLTKIAKEPVEWRRALSIVKQLLMALGEAHKRGIVHRDVKPDNILVEGTPPDERVKVLDFGIARAFTEEAGPQASAELTQAAGGGIVGTPAYISPEQALGERVDPRADLYSSGVTLHRILTGTLPFRSDTPTGFYGQHIAMAPPPIRAVRKDLSFPDPLERLVLKALEKERSKRFQSADEMIAAIDALLDPPKPRPQGSSGAIAAIGEQGRLGALPTGGFDRAKLLLFPTVRRTPSHDDQTVQSTPTPSRAAAASPPWKVFLFALARVRMGRSRPKPGNPGDNAIVLWLLPARSEREDPENYRGTLEISGTHIEVRLEEAGPLVIDTSSRGTKLDGAPLKKGEATPLPERFRLDLAGVLTLEGRRLGAGGKSGVLLRRVRNCENHVYALLRPGGELPLTGAEGAGLHVPGMKEGASVIARAGGGFEIRPEKGARLLRNGQLQAPGESVSPLFGDELGIGNLMGRFDPLDEGDFRDV